MDSPGIRRLHQVALRVEDLDRAIGFYRDVLGLRFLFRAPPGLAFFECGGVRLLLGTGEGDETAIRSMLYYGVEDIRASADLLRERGVRFRGEPAMIARVGDREIWLAEFSDSEGNPAALMSEAPV